MSKEDKVERLENLLSKSIAYSEFLANKLKDGILPLTLDHVFK